MSGFFFTIFKYVSPIILGAILVWRSWGRLEWLFLAIIAVVIGFNFIPQNSFQAKTSEENKLKTEIIAQTKMSAEDIKEAMARKKIKRGRGKSGSIIYPADMEGDYRTYYFTPNLRYTISFNGPEDYDEFFENVDSLMVKGQRVTGCPKDTAYQLAPDCFVCKGGYDSDQDRFVIRVSRTLNFGIPRSSQPTNSTRPNTPPRPYYYPYERVVPYPRLPPIPGSTPNSKFPPPVPKEKKKREMDFG